MIRMNLKTDSVAMRLVRRGTTQNAFAREVGVTSGFMSQMLSGMRCPGPATRRKIMAAPSMKGFTFDDLFDIEVAA